MAGPLPPLAQEPAFQKLQEYFDTQGKDLKIKDLFQNDAKRFSKYRWVLQLSGLRGAMIFVDIHKLCMPTCFIFFFFLHLWSQLWVLYKV